MNTKLLTTEQAAALLGISPITLTKWRWNGKGPESVRLGYRTVRYAQSSIDAWVEKANRSPKSPSNAVSQDH
jgi:excisionase family DNA binding protein